MSELKNSNGLQGEEPSTPSVEETVKKEERVYTQSQLDDIIAKREATLYKNYSKNNVPKSEYEELNNKYQALNQKIKGEEIKKVFIENGGIEGSFEDFIQVNNMLYELEPKELPKAISQIKNIKEHFFANKQTSANNTIVQDLFKQSEKLEPGFIYYKGDGK